MSDEPSTLLGAGESLNKGQAVDLLLNTNAPEEASGDIQEPVAETEEVGQEEILESDEQVEATSEEEFEEEDAVELSESEEEFDGEEYDVDPEDVEYVDEELYTVKVDGEEVQVTSEELVKSYQLEQAAQKRMQEAAEIRKTSEAESVALAQQREKYGRALQAIEAQLNSVPEQPKEYWDKLYQEDPLEWAKQRDAFRDRKENVEKVQAERARVERENQEQMMQQHQEYLVQQHQQLLERIPEWRNEEVAMREKQNVISYAQRIGYSEEELANASDSRAIEVLRKAHLYDELMAGKPAARKKVTKAPKAVKSGTPKTKKQANANRNKQALERLNKTGSKDAAVDLLLERMRS
jgi:hypothetical protein